MFTFLSPLIIFAASSYASSAIGMSEWEATSLGFVLASIGWWLSLIKKPVIKVVAICSSIGGLGSVLVQLSIAHHGVKLEFVLLFSVLAVMVGVLGLALWAAGEFLVCRVRRSASGSSQACSAEETQ